MGVCDDVETQSNGEPNNRLAFCKNTGHSSEITLHQLRLLKFWYVVWESNTFDQGWATGSFCRIFFILYTCFWEKGLSGGRDSVGEGTLLTVES